jgi:hypothetical protein
LVAAQCVLWFHGAHLRLCLAAGAYGLRAHDNAVFSCEQWRTRFDGLPHSHAMIRQSRRSAFFSLPDAALYFCTQL